MNQCRMNKRRFFASLIALTGYKAFLRSTPKRPRTVFEILNECNRLSDCSIGKAPNLYEFFDEVYRIKKARELALNNGRVPPNGKLFFAST